MIKKIVCILLVIILSSALFACGYNCECERYKHTCTEECGDFCLTISVDCTTLRRGKEIEVEITFINLSGQDVELSGSLFASSPFGHSFDVPRSIGIESQIVENLNAIQRTYTMTHREITRGPWGGTSPGRHELIFNFNFWPYEEEQQIINSNSITITVKR